MTTTVQQSEHTFTLTFRNGCVAVVVVKGAADAADAEKLARSGFFGCMFDIVPGDTTNGAVAPFYTRAYPDPCVTIKRSR